MIYDFYLIILLFITIILIVIFISKLEVHPLLNLLFAGLFFGLFSGMELKSIASSLTDGFGSTLSSIGIVIVTGTIIGVFLEKSGRCNENCRNFIKNIQR